MMQNHLRCHLPTSLELSILLQLLYSPTLQPNFIRYQSPVKPSHTPLEAGISVKTTVGALTAQSVQPEGSHLPKAGGWNPGHRSTLKKRSPGNKKKPFGTLDSVLRPSPAREFLYHFSVNSSTRFARRGIHLKIKNNESPTLTYPTPFANFFATSESLWSPSSGCLVTEQFQLDL